MSGRKFVSPKLFGLLFLAILIGYFGYRVWHPLDMSVAFIDPTMYNPATHTPGWDAGTVDEAELPWTSDPHFQRVAKANGTTVLLASFRAFLTDPIGHEADNIEMAANRLRGKVLPAGATFSLNKTLGPYSEENGFLPGPNYVAGRLVINSGGGVCKIATMLYNLTVLGNLQVAFRQPHTMIVPYVPPGQDATVSFSTGPDYIFRNNTASPLLIWSQKVGPALYMAFYSRVQGPRVTWHHRVLTHTPATTVVRNSPDLSPGEERELWPGFDGYAVRSWVEIIFPDGRVQVKKLGISRYRMSPRVVERHL